MKKEGGSKGKEPMHGESRRHREKGGRSRNVNKGICMGCITVGGVKGWDKAKGKGIGEK